MEKDRRKKMTGQSIYKVKIVDDEVMFRSFLKNLIDNKIAGYNVCAQANNGKEALEMLKMGNVPDVILSDIRMPAMNGVEYVKILKEEKLDIPVIVLSNYDDYHYVKDTLKNGAFDYILKHEINEELLQVQLRRVETIIQKCLQNLDLIQALIQ